MKKAIIKILKAVICTAFWLLIWQLAAVSVGNENILPSPISVIARLCVLITETEFYLICANSLVRVLIGILLGLLSGVLCAVLTSAVPIMDTLLSPMISVIKSTPVASFIILVVLWIDKNVLPAFITILIVFPLAWANVSTGIKNTPKELIEVAKVHKMKLPGRIAHIYLPSLIPFFIGTVKSALGLAWKAGIAAEVIAVPLLAIGSEIYTSKQFIETTDLFAWTLVTILLSVAVEGIFVKLLSDALKKYSYEKEESVNAQN